MPTSVAAAIVYSRQLAQTDSNGIGSTLGIAFYNDALQAMTRDLINRGIDAAQTQEAYRDLTTDNPNTYLWPTDMFALKTLEINWSDQDAQNYKQAKILDVANIQDKSFSYLRANQSQDDPLFDNRGDQFEVFPRPTSTNSQGIRIFYFLTPTEVTHVGAAINYPQTLDYRALSCKMAAMYYKSQNDDKMAAIYDAEYESRVGKIIKILAPGTQQPISPKSLALSGWEY